MKLIEDLLVPTGISMKPSDSQLKEFCKKIKTLDKNFICNKLLEKINNYSDITDQNQFKVLNVN